MSADPPTSLESAADWLRKRFDTDAARGVVVAYELDLTGPEGGVLSVRIDDGRLDARRGPHGVPDARLRIAAADFYGILAGRENAELLFMANRIQIEGDLSAAMRFRKFFPRRS
jgi:ubiquinone biosynthesis protein UbiJ